MSKEIVIDGKKYDGIESLSNKKLSELLSNEVFELKLSTMIAIFDENESFDIEEGSTKDVEFAGVDVHSEFIVDKKGNIYLVSKVLSRSYGELADREINEARVAVNKSAWNQIFVSMAKDRNVLNDLISGLISRNIKVIEQKALSEGLPIKFLYGLENSFLLNNPDKKDVTRISGRSRFVWTPSPSIISDLEVESSFTSRRGNMRDYSYFRINIDEDMYMCIPVDSESEITNGLNYSVYYISKLYTPCRLITLDIKTFPKEMIKSIKPSETFFSNANVLDSRKDIGRALDRGEKFINPFGEYMQNKVKSNYSFDFEKLVAFGKSIFLKKINIFHRIIK